MAAALSGVGLWVLDCLDWWTTLLSVAHEVFTQKRSLQGLPALGQVQGKAEGLTCIVTGPTSGIGRETAAELARRGAHVVLACRSRERGDRLRDELVTEARAAGVVAPQIQVEQLDVSCLASVTDFAARWDASQRPLHALVNNAGVMSFGCGRSPITAEGFEVCAATNYLGPYLLTLLLLPHLRRSAKHAVPRHHSRVKQAARQAHRPSRVVNVSSKLHELGRLHGGDGGGGGSAAGVRGNPLRERRAWAAQSYFDSKLAQVMFTVELLRRLPRDSGVQCFVVHPGEATTAITRTLPGPLYRLYQRVLPRILLTTEQAARSSIYCALSRAALNAHAGPEGCYFVPSCQPHRPARRALQTEPARRLWAWSAAAVQLPPQYDLAIV